jgi:hypothetical protein
VERNSNLKRLNPRIGPGAGLMRSGWDPAFVAAAVLTMIALLAVACGGGSSGSSSPTATTGSGGVSAGATGSSGSETTGASAGGDTTQLSDLTDLQSFHWDITLNGASALLAGAGVPAGAGDDADKITASGAWIAPDQAQLVVDTGGFAITQTIKGDQEWISNAGVTSGPNPATSDAQSLVYIASILDPQQDVSPSDLNCGDTETVNGIEAKRCESSEAASQEIVASIGGSEVQATSASLVMWIATDGGYAVRWEFKASGTSGGAPFDWNFVANVTDVNNVTSIEP